LREEKKKIDAQGGMQIESALGLCANED